MRKITKNLISMVVTLVMVVTCVPTVSTYALTPGVAEPFAIKGVTFVENDDGTCTITWDSVDKEVSYQIYKAESRYSDYELVDTVNTNSYTDNNYSSDYYQIYATIDGFGTFKATTSYEIDKFGENTYVFEDTDNLNTVQKVMDDIYVSTEAGQFGTMRQAYLFAPGTYKNASKELTVNIGFYTQVAGLGLSPEDTEVDAIKCKAEWMIGRKYDGGINYNACCNFWRSVENLTTDATNTLWAVSQATAMRRMNFTGSLGNVNKRNEATGEWYTAKDIVGDLYLHQEGGYASGGFLADSKVVGTISMGSQQQWLTRNTIAGEMQAAVWNNVVVGSGSETTDENGNTKITQMKGTSSGWPYGTNTVVDKTPIIQEKPFLMIDTKDVDEDGDTNEYGVFVPELRRDAVGVSWDGEEIAGKFIDIDEFYVAKPTDSVEDINAALDDGMNLILTPGIYKISEPIKINNDNTVVLGLGYATIEVTNGNQAMTIGDVSNTILAGVLFDAGAVKSKALLTVGTSKNDTVYDTYSVALCDTFYRVGGASSAPGTAETCVIINSNNVIGDNFWIWRADHGAGVAWDKNRAEHGVIINGDNVTTYGLMVEHFQKEQTIWNGNGGRCYMYQSELPYDITSQSVWNASGSYGYTDYMVSDNVKTHEGYGIGVYSCYNAATCFLKSAVECPDTPGVKFTNVCSYSLVGNGSIDNVINEAGYPVIASGDMCKIMSYCNGKFVCDKTEDKAKRDVWQMSVEINGVDKYSTSFKVGYTGKAITRKISVKYKGVELRKDVDYTITYKNNKNIGYAKIYIKGINDFKGTKTYTMKIVPKKVTITKAKATKNKINIKYKKVKGAKGYEIKVYKKKTNANKNKKAVLTKTTKKVKLTIKSKKLKDLKQVYVRVRAYGKNAKKKKVYGSWSKVKKAK